MANVDKAAENKREVEKESEDDHGWQWIIFWHLCTLRGLELGAVGAAPCAHHQGSDQKHQEVLKEGGT